jgi:hypothetical protein
MCDFINRILDDLGAILFCFIVICLSNFVVKLELTCFSTFWLMFKCEFTFIWEVIRFPLSFNSFIVPFE